MKSFLILSFLVLGVSCQSHFLVGGKCDKSIDCGRGTSHICVDGKCIELKPFQRTFHGFAGCPEGQILIGKKCYRTWPSGIVSDDHRPFSDLCSTGADCGSQSVCHDGKCVVDNGLGGKCSVGAHCPNGYICVNGKCQKSKRHFTKSCPLICPNGPCIDGECQGGMEPHRSSNHRSFGPKKCSTIIDCGHASQLCVDGKCVVDNGHGGRCSSDAFCPNNFVCIDGKCEESRRHFDLPCVHECLPGQRCNNGVCESIPMYNFY